MILKKKILVFAILLSLYCFSSGMAKEVISITGAGPSIDIADKFITTLRKTPWIENSYQFRLDPDSTKHAGGIRNTDRNLFGRTGRPLTSDEKASGKREVFLAEIPIVFVTNYPIGIDQLTLNELKSVYDRTVVNWSQLGGIDTPVFLVGREETESIFVLLKSVYPFFESVRFDVVLHNDTAVVNYLKHTTKNALTFGAYPNLTLYNLIRIKGMNLSRKVGFVFDKKNDAHPLVKAVIRTAESRQWKSRLSSWGYHPVSP